MVNIPANANRSIDPSKIDMSKFLTVFKTIDLQMQKQTMVLESILNVTKESRADKDRADKFEKMNQDNEKLKYEANKQVAEASEHLDNMRGPTEYEQPSAGIGAGLAAFLGFELGKGGVMASALSVALRAGFIAVVAKPLGDFLSGVASQALERMNFDSSVAETAGGLIADGGIALLAGKLLGTVLGKRLGMMLAIGGFLFKELNDVLDKDGDGIARAFGLEFNSKVIAGIGAVLGSVFAVKIPSLLARALTPLKNISIPNITQPASKLAGQTAARLPSAGKFLPSAVKTVGKIGGALASLPVQAAIATFTPTRMGDGSIQGAIEKTIDRIIKDVLQNPEKTVKEKAELAVKVIQNNKQYFEENGTVDLQGEDGKSVSVSTKTLLDPSFWAAQLKVGEYKSKAPESLNKTKSVDNMAIKGVQFDTESPGNLVFDSIDSSNKWRFDNNSKAMKYKSIDVIKQEKATKSNNSSVSNDNKSSTVVNQAGNSVTTINNISTSPSYSLNHFLPQ